MDTNPHLRLHVRHCNCRNKVGRLPPVNRWNFCSRAMLPGSMPGNWERPWTPEDWMSKDISSYWIGRYRPCSIHASRYVFRKDYYKTDGISGEKVDQNAEQQGEKYTGNNRNSNILPLSTIGKPAGKTGGCSEQIHGEYLKNRLQHGVIINEGMQEKSLVTVCNIINLLINFSCVIINSCTARGVSIPGSHPTGLAPNVASMGTLFKLKNSCALNGCSRK
jgi:hypothetical protein